MSETTPPPEASSDPPEPGDVDVYEVVAGPDETARVEGMRLPRRRDRGRRGVLLVDRPGSLVYLLDADDDRRVFVGRARRPLAGDPASITPAPPGVDDLVRAAHEFEYDVIAAEWIDGDADDDAPPATAAAASPTSGG